MGYLVCVFEKHFKARNYGPYSRCGRLHDVRDGQHRERWFGRAFLI